MTTDNGTNRTFDTGATRDTAQDKLEYMGFLSPIVLQRFAQYMHKNRHMRDGSLRDSNNWQKGIPLDVYEQSLGRHFVDFWLHHRGWGHMAEEADFETVLTAIMFNTMGYLHELLKQRIGRPLAELLLVADNYTVHDVPCGRGRVPHDAHFWESASEVYHCEGFKAEEPADVLSEAVSQGFPQTLAETCDCPEPCITRPVWQSPPGPKWGGSEGTGAGE